MIRIVIAEDQALVLGALAALLGLEDDIEVIGRAKDGPSALDLVMVLKPDVLVTDIEMPGMLYGAILRSPLPHARVRNVDLAAARRVAAITPSVPPCSPRRPRCRRRSRRRCPS